MRPITVTGGQWGGVIIRGGNLSRLDLSGLDLREADLSLTDLVGLGAARLPARRGHPARHHLDGTDLRGASLDRVDLAAARLRRTKLDLPGAVLLAELHGADVDVSPDAWIVPTPRVTTGASGGGLR